MTSVHEDPEVVHQRISRSFREDMQRREEEAQARENGNRENSENENRENFATDEIAKIDARENNSREIQTTEEIANSSFQSAQLGFAIALVFAILLIWFHFCRKN